MGKVRLYLMSTFAFFYYLFIQLTGKLLFWVKPKQRVTLLVSFPDNSREIIKEYIKHQYHFELRLVLTRHAVNLDKEFPAVPCFKLKETSPIGLIVAIYYLLSSKTVITDNYFVATTVLTNKKNIECIQVWHANGAFKKFGLQDITIKNRNKSDIERFKKVYNSFNKIVVGSEKMADIFSKSFGLTHDCFLRFGVPLTDQYFRSLKENNIYKTRFKNKKIILYAPTFRDNDFGSVSLPFSEEELKIDLKGNYVLLVKLHPVMRERANFPESNWIIDVSHENLPQLIRESDLLISDYSSVPFEFALLAKPILFYTYDLEAYDETRGLIDNYTGIIPGVPCSNSKMLLNQLKDMDKLQSEVERFSREWNLYSRGNASKQLLSYINEKSN
ncbi:CDP-glycerol glycerophosphotransferase family protein [Bacillus tequilensis]|uniref:CDP-glycerol--glycerophosphate glycerophosphotransferase n=1 Tax=Bacillus tequilensis TaxID=227866 RepID=A0A6H0WQL9_9BACI|nr:CDP-glycerol glycerophosphotransferase family protein [Bacillus tequilensis]QIW81603.1 CDP-glycerol--glycerophosphate glycerophosphotransferase [Bacillus tequilensis]